MSTLLYTLVKILIRIRFTIKIIIITYVHAIILSSDKRWLTTDYFDLKMHKKPGILTYKMYLNQNFFQLVWRLNHYQQFSLITLNYKSGPLHFVFEKFDFRHISDMPVAFHFLYMYDLNLVIFFNLQNVRNLC